MQREWKRESLKFVLVLIAKRVGFLILQEHGGLERGGQCTSSFPKKTIKGAIFITETERDDQIPATLFVLMKLHEGRAGRGLETQRRKKASKRVDGQGCSLPPTSGWMFPPLRLKMTRHRPVIMHKHRGTKYSHLPDKRRR